MCMPMRAWVYACVFTCPCVSMWTCVMWTSQVKGRCLPPSLAWHLLFETKSPLESGAHWSVSWALGPRGSSCLLLPCPPCQGCVTATHRQVWLLLGAGITLWPSCFCSKQFTCWVILSVLLYGFWQWMVSTIPVLEWLGSPVGCPSGFIFHGEILRLDLLFQGFFLLAEAWHFYSRVLEHTL